MKTNKYTDLKNIFIDGKIFDYLDLDKKEEARNKLITALKEPMKIILISGNPGCGKTFLLTKVYEDLKKEKQKIALLTRPFFNELEFINQLHVKVWGEKSIGYHSYNEFINESKRRLKKDEVIILLVDEAQLYSQDLLEKIRIMSDTRHFKVVFTVHKTQKEDILAKEYFTTRIWQTIELTNSTSSEVQTYIEKKFLFHSKLGHISIINPNVIKDVMRYTNGNLREINRYFYKLFEIMEYYEEHKPTELKNNKISKKILTMGAMHAGVYDA